MLWVAKFAKTVFERRRLKFCGLKSSTCCKAFWSFVHEHIYLVIYFYQQNYTGFRNKFRISEHNCKKYQTMSTFPFQSLFNKDIRKNCLICWQYVSDLEFQKGIKLLILLLRLSKTKKTLLLLLFSHIFSSGKCSTQKRTHK